MNWILLRGLSRESAHWGNFVEYFTEAMGQDNVYCVDLPGTGLRLHEASPHSVAEIAESVIEQIGGVQGPKGLVALSLGGMVAIDIMQKQSLPDLSRVVLMNTSTAFSPFWQRMRPDNYPRLMKVAVARGLRDRERAILQMTSNKMGSSIAVLQDWVEIQEERGISRINTLRQLWAAARYRPEQQTPTVPCLLLSSKGDRMVSYRCSQTLAKRWGASIQIHPSAGHDLPLDDPAWVISQIQTWCQSS
ncbi:MAG: alpha/beta hydrolase [Pseudomonadales bacterium]|nr:alpha/beta hydrolase [Pseudomonadales bacterium]